MSFTNSSKLLKSNNSERKLAQVRTEEENNINSSVVKENQRKRHKGEERYKGVNQLSKSTVNFSNKQNTGSSCLSQVEQDCLKTIITQNAKYYQDKTKVCCSLKPTKHRLMLPHHTGNTIYKQDFISKDGFQPATSLRFEDYKSKSPFMNTSNYNASFIPHKISPRKRNYQASQLQADAPRFLQSQYKGDFKKWDTRPDNIKVQYPQNYFLGGGEMLKKTVYGSDFVPKGNNRLGHCKYSDSALFADWNVPKNSHYQDEYTKKPHYENSNYKLKNSYTPTVGLPNYNSEYKAQFDPKKKTGCSYRKILTVEELQNLILNI